MRVAYTRNKQQEESMSNELTKKDLRKINALIRKIRRQSRRDMRITLFSGTPKNFIVEFENFVDDLKPIPVDFLLNLLSDEDDYVRAASARVLGKIKDNSLNQKLIQLLEDENQCLRAGAAETFFFSKDKSAVQPLIKMLLENNLLIQKQAIRTLGEIGDIRAVGPLMDLYKTNPNLESDAKFAIKNFKRKKMIDSVEDIYREYKNSAQYKTGNLENLGTLLRDEEHAHSWWSLQHLAKNLPILVYRFENIEQAKEAILSLEYIHESNGRLISSRVIDYGCYLNSENQGEVVLGGQGLNKKVYKDAKARLRTAGGTFYRSNKPEAEPVKRTQEISDWDEDNVRFVKTTQKQLAPDVMATYETYQAPDEASAMAFLKPKLILKPLYYLVVETPQGNFGRDIDGIYKE